MINKFVKSIFLMTTLFCGLPIAQLFGDDCADLISGAFRAAAGVSAYRAGQAAASGNRSAAVSNTVRAAAFMAAAGAVGSGGGASRGSSSSLINHRRSPNEGDIVPDELSVPAPTKLGFIEKFVIISSLGLGAGVGLPLVFINYREAEKRKEEDRIFNQLYLEEQASTPPRLPWGDHVGGGCFGAGTLIETPSGPKSIESLRPGDEVYSYNFNNGAVEVGIVKRTFTHEGAMAQDIILSNGSKIQTTPNHPFFDPQSAAWRSVGEFELQAPMAIRAPHLDLTGGGLDLITLAFKGPLSSATVYNFEVQPHNTYFVLGNKSEALPVEGGVLVHNKNLEEASP